MQVGSGVSSLQSYLLAPHFPKHTAIIKCFPWPPGINTHCGWQFPTSHFTLLRDRVSASPWQHWQVRLPSNHHWFSNLIMDSESRCRCFPGHKKQGRAVSRHQMGPHCQPQQWILFKISPKWAEKEGSWRNASLPPDWFQKYSSDSLETSRAIWKECKDLGIWKGWQRKWAHMILWASLLFD